MHFLSDIATWAQQLADQLNNALHLGAESLSTEEHGSMVEKVGLIGDYLNEVDLTEDN